MAQIPTPESSARKILSQFKVAKRRAGEVLMLGAVQLNAQKEGLRKSDIDAGLNYAAENGWIDLSDQKFVRITEVGFGEI